MERRLDESDDLNTAGMTCDTDGETFFLHMSKDTKKLYENNEGWFFKPDISKHLYDFWNGIGQRLLMAKDTLDHDDHYFWYLQGKLEVVNMIRVQLSEFRPIEK